VSSRQSTAKAPIGANRPNVALARRRIVPDPRRKGIESERGQIVAKMRVSLSIVNGALRLPGFACVRSSREFFLQSDNGDVGVEQDEKNNESADKGPECDSDKDLLVCFEFLLKVRKRFQCTRRHWQWCLSSMLLSAFRRNVDCSSFLGVRPPRGARSGWD